MFEKFTENAIKSIINSRQEARRLEFGYVQPEHLFLGLLHDRISITSLLLSKFNIDLKKARRVVEKLIGRGYSNVPLEEISFSIEVMEIISNSVLLASELSREAVSSEIILLAILKSNRLNVKKLIEELNIDIDALETEIKLFWEDDKLIPVEEDLPKNYSYKYLTPLSKSILECARDETIKQGHVFIGTEQLLLCLSKKKYNSISSKILSRFSLDEMTIRLEINRIVGKGSGTNLNILSNTSMLEKSLEFAWIEAKRFSYVRIGTGHLLAGITSIDNCTSGYIIKYFGIDPEQIRWETLEILRKYEDTPEPDINLDDIII
jgi:ATP-dependent Clp protease ATP-binding subunit ClpA